MYELHQYVWLYQCVWLYQYVWPYQCVWNTKVISVSSNLPYMSGPLPDHCLITSNAMVITRKYVMYTMNIYIHVYSLYTHTRIYIRVDQNKWVSTLHGCTSIKCQLCFYVEVFVQNGVKYGTLYCWKSSKTFSSFDPSCIPCCVSSSNFGF